MWIYLFTNVVEEFLIPLLLDCCFESVVDVFAFKEDDLVRLVDCFGDS